MVLLVSTENDEHGRAVGERLSAMGRRWGRVSAMEVGSGLGYAIDPLAAAFGVSRWCVAVAGEAGAVEIGVEEIESIYWRRPIRSGEALMESHPCAEELSSAEGMAAFRQAMACFERSKFPLGHPDAIREADNKLKQLRLAREAGFEVPETRVGNEPGELAAFVARHEFCVVKPLKHGVVFEGTNRSEVATSLWCREFPSAVLLEHLKGAKSVQMLVQQAVKKVEDWRITVLPGRTICCRIDTSRLPNGEPDWRKRTMELTHQIIEVSAAFEGKLRRYLELIDMPAGYFDFAVTAEGMPIFLEMNPNGQWLWMEQLTGYPISEAIAKALVRI